MGYTQDNLVLAQKNLQDFLNKQKSGIDPSIQASRDYLSGLDANRASSTQDILGQVAGKYGIDPNISAAGADMSAYEQPGIAAKREAALVQIRMGKVQDSLTKQFNQVMDQYQAAGYDRRTSEAFARQWAAQKNEQDNAASMAASGRDFAQKKADITNQFQTQYNALADMPPAVNPYEQALYRSLAGVATAAVGYAIINGKKVPVNSKGQLVNSPTNSPSLPPELNLDYNAA